MTDADRRGEEGARRPPAGQTVLGATAADRMLAYVGFGALGTLLGWLLPVIARWALGLSVGLPFRPVFKLFGSVDRPWELAIHLTLWTLAGLGVAVVGMRDSAKITVTDSELRVDKNDLHRSFGRDQVSAVFLDGKKVVVLDRESRQVVRETAESARSAVAAAFQAHGYPWQESDPYADLYRRWVPDSIELPPAVNDVLAAREVALKKKAGTEVGHLYDAVEKLSFAVRDEGTRQYWRPLVRS